MPLHHVEHVSVQQSNVQARQGSPLHVHDPALQRTRRSNWELQVLGRVLQTQSAHMDPARPAAPSLQCQPAFDAFLVVKLKGPILEESCELALRLGPQQLELAIPHPLPRGI